MKKILWFFGIVIIGLIGFCIYFLNAAMPTGTGYSAKYICSQVFLAERDPAVVFENDVKPTHPLFGVIKFKVNRDTKTVTAKGFGFWSPMTAVYRDGCGCTLAVDTPIEELLNQSKGFIPQQQPNTQRLWPAGEAVNFKNIPSEVDTNKLQSVIESAFQEPGPDTKRNTQAVVVVYKDRIIAEKYADQFSPSTPILGWSMSKSVTNALVGILVKDKKLDIMKPAPVSAWTDANDPRSKILLDQMLRMSSGLEFQEVYAPFKDATKMLYNSKSMADYAAAKPLRTEPDNEWYYSSGTTNIIARIIRDTLGGTLSDVTNFARTRLFDRVGMYSAIIEPDASGSLVGSSYMFATPRDWARFGVFIKNDGIWNGQRILPAGWVKYSTTPTPMAPKGEYGAQFWLNAGNKDNVSDKYFPSLPSDMIFLHGFNSQITAIFPSKNTVIVRMGVTHSKADWDEEGFIRQVLECIKS
ncbi:MAG: serine hydrolase [Deltaproteobacteria bacterium]|nr:serine hydrolase [Deltaproteobacteria bacterium]